MQLARLILPPLRVLTQVFTRGAYTEDFWPKDVHQALSSSCIKPIAISLVHKENGSSLRSLEVPVEGYSANFLQIGAHDDARLVNRVSLKQQS